MGTLYIDRRGTDLDFERGALVVREPDTPPRSVPLSLVERLVIVGNVGLSSALLTRLADNGTAVAVLPARGQRRSAFLLGCGHGDAVRRIGQYRLATDRVAQQAWSSRLVRLRLAGQQRVLRCALAQRPDRRAQLIKAQRTIRNARLGLHDDAGGGDRLRGREGSATAAYFEAYATLFPSAAEFTGRNRRPPRDPVNAALSLGYTLTHGDALRCVVAHGLEPTVGIYHRPSWNRESLACDLVELARARVERFVWQLFAQRVVTAESFSRSGEGVRLAKSARGRFFACWEKHAATHRRWLDRAARTVARASAHIGQETIAEADPDDAAR